MRGTDDKKDYGSVAEAVAEAVAETKQYYENGPQQDDKPQKAAPAAAAQHHAHHSILGILLIMLGAFSFSCMFLLVKVMNGTADSFTLVFYRSLVQMSISFCSIIKNGEHLLGERSAWGWLLVRGGFGSAAVIAFFYAIQQLPLPDAVTLQFTTPPFAAAFAVCFAGEKWTRLDMIGAVVCILGVALIAHPSWLFGYHDNNDTISENNASSVEAPAVQDPVLKAFAISVALLGAALAGMAYMSVRIIGHRASANVMVLYYSTMSIPMVLLGSKVFLGKWSVWGSDYYSPWDYFLFLLTGFAGYGGQLFTNLGLQRETAATGTLAICTQIVWTYIFELAFLHEAINGWSVSGTCLILGFMLYVGYLKTRKQNNNTETEASESEEETALLAPDEP